MIKSCLVFFAIAVLAARAAHAQDRFSGIRETVPFESGQGDYHTYRIPALAVSVKGTVLAFCEGRKAGSADWGDIDLLVRRSTDQGRTWDATHVIVDDGADTCGNPSPVVDRRTGVIWLVLTKGKGDVPEDLILKNGGPPRTVWITKSEDDGVTWSPAADVSATVRKPDWSWYATGPGHGIQLADGRLVIPCNHSIGHDTQTWHSHLIFSTDGGATWQLGGVQEGKTNESTIVELADGALYQNMRNYRGTHRRAFAVSNDKGMTWTPVADDPALIEPVCQASALRLTTVSHGGRNRVLFSNPASEKRELLTVRLSYDECKTWSVAKTLHPGPSAYSDLVALGDGMIGCLYERGTRNPYETITFARFTLDWLTDGKDHL